MADAPNYSDFAARFPELATDDADRQAWIAALLQEAHDELDATTWGTRHARAAMLLTAHQAALRLGREQGRGAAGQVVSERVGDLGRAWTSNQPARGSDGWYELSDYGREYLSLRAAVVGGPWLG